VSGTLTTGYEVHRIIILAVVGAVMAIGTTHMLTTASHAMRSAHTAARLLRCDADALDRYDAAAPTDPAVACAGIARRLQAETGAGEAAVAPAPSGQ
jgi:hypothetical protein